jgi:hypothetical protein
MSEYSFLPNVMMAWSNSSPATRIDWEVTMPPSDLGGAAADVHHHVPGGLVDRQAGPDGRGHRLLDDVHPAGAGLVPGFLDRALLHPGDAAGHRDDDPGFGQVTAAVHLLDEVAQHPLGHVEVGDDPVLQRAHGHDVARRPPDHPFSFDPDGDDLARVGIQGHHGGFVEHDAAAPDVDQGVRGAEVDRHVTAQKRQRVAHKEREPSKKGLLDDLCCYSCGLRPVM